MQGLLSDLRHAARLYRATPFSSLVAIVTLSVSIACLAASFSLASDLFLKPHPGFERSRDLVTIGSSDGTQMTPMAPEAIERMREEATFIETIVGVGSRDMRVVPASASTAPVEWVTSGFFAVIRPRVQLGRGFNESDHAADAEPVAVISHDYWVREFGGDADAIGKEVTITGNTNVFALGPNGRPAAPKTHTVNYRIVGVMSPILPSAFLESTAMWVPYEQAAPLFVAAGPLATGSASLRGLARLRQGVSIRAARAQLRSRFADMPLRAGFRLDVHRGVVRDINTQLDGERQAALFLAGSVLLALVAAGNISLFLLSRAPGRRREIGVRMAIGAPLRRIARQFATEAGLLVLVSAAVGMALSLWLGVYIQSLPLFEQTQLHDVSLDWRSLSLVAISVLLLTAAVSIAPIASVRQTRINDSSRRVAARAGISQWIAGTVQIAMAGAIGGAALAFIWHLVLLSVDRGFVVENIHVARTGASTAEANSYVTRQRRREALLSIPGVSAVAFGNYAPSVGSIAPISMPHPLLPGETVLVAIVETDHAYAALLGMNVAHGRLPEEEETDAILVNESLATAVWARTDVVGETLPLRGSSQGTLVGVLSDVSFGRPSSNVTPMMYVTGTSTAFLNDYFLIESTLPSSELRQALEQAVESGTLEAQILDVAPLKSYRNRLLAPDRARGTITSGSAVIVVLLAIFGFYGTQRYLVMAGRREYAIRAALGAGPSALGLLVMGRGFALGFPGLAIGGVLAFVAVRFLHDGFIAQEVPAQVIASAVALGTALLLFVATVGPSRQARRTDIHALLRGAS